MKVKEMGKGRVPTIREKEKGKRKGDFKKCLILATMIIYAPICVAHLVYTKKFTLTNSPGKTGTAGRPYLFLPGCTETGT